jgi:molybdopterin converting factor small subunit
MTQHSIGAAQPGVTVFLAPALLRLFPEAERQVEIPATNVNELMSALDYRWPGMRDRLVDSTPAIRRHINVFVEGKRATLQTPLRPGAKVWVLTSVSGG